MTLKLSEAIRMIKIQRDLFKMDESDEKVKDKARIVRKQLDMVLHLLQKIDK